MLRVMISITRHSVVSYRLGVKHASALFSSFASLNGVPTNAATLTCSVWDASFQRGDGVFEVCRVIAGKPRCVEVHLDRLERSAAAISLKLPATRQELEQWIRDAAAAAGGENGMVRVMITRGGGSQGYGHHLGNELHAPPSTFILWQPLPAQPESYRLLPMCAPWHSGGFDNKDWAAVKWLSYGAHVHSTRLAQKRGYDDALLLSRGDERIADIRDRVVLDGPNWALAWIRNDGTFCTPSWKELGLLESTSCMIALEAAQRMGVPVEEGIFTLADVEQHATAIWAMSTTRDLIPVVSLGTTNFSMDNLFRNELRKTMDTVIDEHD